MTCRGESCSNRCSDLGLNTTSFALALLGAWILLGLVSSLVTSFTVDVGSGDSCRAIDLRFILLLELTLIFTLGTLHELAFALIAGTATVGLALPFSFRRRFMSSASRFSADWSDMTDDVAVDTSYVLVLA
jgi:hypothetical protein